MRQLTIALFALLLFSCSGGAGQSEYQPAVVPASPTVIIHDAGFELHNGRIEAFVVVMSDQPTEIIVYHDNGTGYANAGVVEQIGEGLTTVPVTNRTWPEITPYGYEQTIPYLDVWIAGEPKVRVWPVPGYNS